MVQQIRLALMYQKTKGNEKLEHYFVTTLATDIHKPIDFQNVFGDLKKTSDSIIDGHSLEETKPMTDH